MEFTALMTAPVHPVVVLQLRLLVLKAFSVCRKAAKWNRSPILK